MNLNLSTVFREFRESFFKLIYLVWFRHFSRGLANLSVRIFDRSTFYIYFGMQNAPVLVLKGIQYGNLWLLSKGAGGETGEKVTQFRITHLSAATLVHQRSNAQRKGRKNLLSRNHDAIPLAPRRPYSDTTSVVMLQNHRGGATPDFDQEYRSAKALLCEDWPYKCDLARKSAKNPQNDHTYPKTIKDT